MQDKRVYFNGYNIEEEKYFINNFKSSKIVDLIKKDKIIKEQHKPHYDEAILRLKSEKVNKYFDFLSEIDPNDLSQAGWGILFAENTQIDMIELALKPLLDLRKKQAGDFYVCFKGATGYKKNMDKKAFLRQCKNYPWSQSQKRIPYYLLLVGSPEQISFEFEFELSIQFAVGRIYFPTIDEYSHYAQNVIACEYGVVHRPRQISLFATDHDPATHLSSNYLVGALENSLRKSHQFSGWNISSIKGEKASKENLSRLIEIKDSNSPALLVSSTHGVICQPFSKQQPLLQGGIICDAFLEKRRPILHADYPDNHSLLPSLKVNLEDFIYQAEDISKNSNLQGLIHLCFSGFSAGTSKYDSWYNLVNGNGPLALSDEHFCARLPQKILGHSHGGLAFVGYVGPMWNYAFLWPGITEQTDVTFYVIDQLVKGNRLGYAMEAYRSHYVKNLYLCDHYINELIYHKHFEDKDLGRWVSRNDARHCVIFGDPAVKLVYNQDSITTKNVTSLAFPESRPDHLQYTMEGGREDVDRRLLLENLRELQEQTSKILAESVAHWTQLEVKTYGLKESSKQQTESEDLLYSTSLSLKKDAVQLIIDHPEFIISDEIDAEGLVDVGSIDKINTSSWVAHKAALEQARIFRLEMFKVLSELLDKLPK